MKRPLRPQPETPPAPVRMPLPEPTEQPDVPGWYEDFCKRQGERK